MRLGELSSRAGPEAPLRALLRVTPDEASVAASAGMARRRALARFGAEPVPARRWSWKPALALAGLCALAIALVPFGRETAPVVTRPVADPLRVQMKLSDGTRVEWTFHEDFRL